MRSSFLRPPLLMTLLAITAAGCGNSTNTVTTPTVTPVVTTDTFDGALSPGGTNYHTFTAKTGDVVLTMKGIGPDPTVKVGMSIGVYTVLTCTAVMDNPSTTIGSQLIGTATATTSLCISVYDIGTIPTGTTLSYELTVTHY